VAIVKANYTKSGANAKASVRYIQHRAGKDGQKTYRTLFGIDGELEREEAYTIIDEAKKGTRFFRFVISPDPKLEDTGKDLNLREITEKTILGLGKQLRQTIQFVGAIHNDHAPHRHVHVIALVQGKLTPNDFALLRQIATEESLFQRRERDLAQGIKKQQGVRHELELSI
jgi:hypothetical protein